MIIGTVLPSTCAVQLKRHRASVDARAATLTLPVPQILILTLRYAACIGQPSVDCSAPIQLCGLSGLGLLHPYGAGTAHHLPPVNTSKGMQRMRPLAQRTSNAGMEAETGTAPALVEHLMAVFAVIVCHQMLSLYVVKLANRAIIPRLVFLPPN